MKEIKKLFKSKIGKIVAILLALLAAYYVAARYQREKAIAAYIAKIKADDAWFAEVKAKAEAAGISLAQQLRRDALWLIAKGDDKNAWWNF